MQALVEVIGYWSCLDGGDADHGAAMGGWPEGVGKIMMRREWALVSCVDQTESRERKRERE